MDATGLLQRFLCQYVALTVPVILYTHVVMGLPQYEGTVITVMFLFSSSTLWLHFWRRIMFVTMF